MGDDYLGDCDGGCFQEGLLMRLAGIQVLNSSDARVLDPGPGAFFLKARLTNRLLCGLAFRVCVQ